MDIKNKVPTKFKLLGSTINIIWDNDYCNKKNVYGEMCYPLNTITMASSVGLDELGEDQIMDAFYHERVHAILGAMNKHELNSDEEFVDMFGKLLRQADITAEYKLNK